MLLAALSPEPQKRAGKDQAEDQQSCGNEAGHRVERQRIAPVLRLEGNVEGSKGENGSEQQSEKQATRREAQSLLLVQPAHANAPLREFLDGFADRLTKQQ